MENLFRSYLKITKNQPNRLYLVIISTMFLLLGCQESTLTTQTDLKFDEKFQSSPVTYNEFMQKINRPFLYLSDEIPGFGGIFLEDKGTVIVIRAKNIDKLDKADIQSKIRNYLAKEYPVVGSHLEGGVHAMRVRFEAANFEYIQLKKWHDQFLPIIINQDGVSFVSISNTDNKILIGVEGNKNKDSLLSILNNKGVPEQAFNVSVTGKVQLESHTLRDYVRPLAGGLGWELETDNFFDIFGYGRCTYGFNAMQGGVSYWVTNSHCTEQFWAVNSSTDYYQHSSSAGSHIGNEAKDPYGFTIPMLCYSNAPCRWSDSALIQHNSGVSIDFGRIVRTTFSSGPGQGAGSLVINHNIPTFHIHSKANNDIYFEGLWLNKVGQRTGWTTGQINGACATINSTYQGQNYRLLCQTLATYTSAGGDSGSPVFNRPYNNQNHVRLYGIHWGRTGNLAIFSRITGVENDLGALTVY